MSERIARLFRRLRWRLQWTFPKCEACGGRIFRISHDGPWNHISPSPFHRDYRHPVWYGPKK